MHFDAEQLPNQESRLYLDNEKVDEIGVPQIVVDYRVDDRDIEGVARCLEIVAEELEASGVAEINFDGAKIRREIAENTGVGSHNYSSTRMASAPEDGVVDSNCQVFGVEGLYVCSSSVLPTTSFANPALTICAIGVRLGRHLKQLSWD